MRESRAPIAAHQRRHVRKKPQEFLMDVGDVLDISITNRLNVGPSVAMVRYSPDPTISSFEELLTNETSDRAFD